MLTGYIVADGRALPWIVDATGWRSGDSVVEPYANPALESFSLVAGGRRAFIVREKARRHGLAVPTDVEISLAEFDRRVAEQLQWPLDFVVLTLAEGTGDPVRVQAGGWSTAPLFLMRDGAALRFHWDMARLYPYLRSPVDFARAAYVLRHMGTPLSRRTLFPEIVQLTERARATWNASAGTLDVEYPPAVAHSLARRLIPGADVLGAFKELMLVAIDRWCGDDVGACELSGGLDSGTAAMVASKASGRAIRTYGLIVPDQAGDQQILRRAEVVMACGAADVTVPAMHHLPFCNGERSQDDAVVPFGEYYHEAFQALLRRAKADGCNTILRGIGGDEISQPQPNEPYEKMTRRDDQEVCETPSFLTLAALEASVAVRTQLDPAPPGIADRSVYEAATASSTVYLRSGIWPYYPYATPELIEFCRCLPAEWRLGRTLQRRFLERSGLSRRVSHPEMPESFLPVMNFALRHQARAYVESLFRESRLAALGLVSQDALLQSYHRYCNSDRVGEGEFLMETLYLEATLRAVERAQT